jgi:hypothetical protein
MRNASGYHDRGWVYDDVHYEVHIHEKVPPEEIGATYALVRNRREKTWFQMNKRETIKTKCNEYPKERTHSA